MSDKSKRIKELEAEVEALKAENAAQKAQIDDANRHLKEAWVALKDAELDMMHMRRSLKICQQG